jgi:hypothetical protein
VKTAKQSNGRGTASLIISIISFFLPFIGLILAIVSIVLAVKQFKIEKTGAAKTGLVLGIISIFFNIAVAAVITLFFGFIIFAKEVADVASFSGSYRINQCTGSAGTLEAKKQCIDSANLTSAGECLLITGIMEDYCYKATALKTMNASLCTTHYSSDKNFEVDCYASLMNKTALKCDYGDKEMLPDILLTFEEAPEEYKTKNSWGEYALRWDNHTKTVYKKFPDKSWYYTADTETYTSPGRDAPQWVLNDIRGIEGGNEIEFAFESFPRQYYKIWHFPNTENAKTTFNVFLNQSKNEKKSTKSNFDLGIGEDRYSYFISGNLTHYPMYVNVYRSGNFVVAGGAYSQNSVTDAIQMVHLLNNKMCRIS